MTRKETNYNRIIRDLRIEIHNLKMDNSELEELVEMANPPTNTFWSDSLNHTIFRKWFVQNPPSALSAYERFPEVDDLLAKSSIPGIYSFLQDAILHLTQKLWDRIERISGEHTSQLLLEKSGELRALEAVYHLIRFCEREEHFPYKEQMSLVLRGEWEFETYSRRITMSILRDPHVRADVKKRIRACKKGNVGLPDSYDADSWKRIIQEIFFDNPELKDHAKRVRKATKRVKVK